MAWKTNEQASTMTTETLLSRMADALGGPEKLRQVENIYMRGKVEVAVLSGTVDDWQMAPDFLKTNSGLW